MSSSNSGSSGWGDIVKGAFSTWAGDALNAKYRSQQATTTPITIAPGAPGAPAVYAGAPATSSGISPTMIAVGAAVVIVVVVLAVRRGG